MTRPVAISAWPAWIAITAVLLTFAGCGGSNFGAELQARPKPEPLGSTAEQVLHLPQDRPFSIALAPAHQSPGLGGQAHGTAEAEPTGRAAAVADVQGGGSANGQFQLGHVFQNDTDRQLGLRFHLRWRQSYHVEADLSQGPVDALVGLKLYVRDHYNVLVRNDDLLRQAAADGAAQRSGTEELQFEQTLAPGQILTVFLAGQADVNAKLDRSAHCELRVEAVELEVRARAAPPATAPGE